MTFITRVYILAEKGRFDIMKLPCVACFLVTGAVSLSVGPSTRHGGAPARGQIKKLSSEKLRSRSLRRSSADDDDDDDELPVLTEDPRDFRARLIARARAGALEVEDAGASGKTSETWAYETGLRVAASEREREGRVCPSGARTSDDDGRPVCVCHVGGCVCVCVSRLACARETTTEGPQARTRFRAARRRGARRACAKTRERERERGVWSETWCLQARSSPSGLRCGSSTSTSASSSWSSTTRPSRRASS